MDIVVLEGCRHLSVHCTRVSLIDTDNILLLSFCGKSTNLPHIVICSSTKYIFTTYLEVDHIAGQYDARYVHYTASALLPC